jgi:hypothetical protein
MPESKIDSLSLFFKFRAVRRLAACFFQAMIANCWWMQSEFSRRMLARQASAGDEDPGGPSARRVGLLSNYPVAPTIQDTGSEAVKEDQRVGVVLSMPMRLAEMHNGDEMPRMNDDSPSMRMFWIYQWCRGVPLDGLGRTQFVQAQCQRQHTDCAEPKVKAEPKKN